MCQEYQNVSTKYSHVHIFIINYVDDNALYLHVSSWPQLRRIKWFVESFTQRRGSSPKNRELVNLPNVKKGSWNHWKNFAWKWTFFNPCEKKSIFTRNFHISRKNGPFFTLGIDQLLILGRRTSTLRERFNKSFYSS